MLKQLKLREILEGEDWISVVKSYERFSQIDRFDAYFDRPQSIHGVRHARRVLFHTLILCEMCSVGEQDKDLLVSAALFHDIGRDNDGLCFKHGKRSAEKMVALDLVPAERETTEILKYIVTYHCIGDSQAEADLHLISPGSRDRTWRLFSVLKDADGLDRVRIGDLDINFMRNPEAIQLENLAHELLVHI